MELGWIEIAIVVASTTVCSMALTLMLVDKYLQGILNCLEEILDGK